MVAITAQPQRQRVRQPLDEVHGRVTVLGRQRVELAARQQVQVGVAHGHGIGGARLVVEKGHLAKEVTAAK